MLLPIILPLVIAIVVFIIGKKFSVIAEWLVFLTTLVGFVVCARLFNHNIAINLPWAGYGLEFNLRLYNFNSFILLAISGFGLLVSLYSIAFMKSKNYLNQFYSYFLISIAFASGAVLANNLILLLFFWEGLLVTLFGLIVIGNPNAYKTATKAFVIVGISDLCMMIGIGITAFLAHTLTISQIGLPIDSGLSALAFILLMIGAISKAGSVPFHTWIPDAAIDAPLPFMAIMPASLEKLLGIYFLARISFDLYKLQPNSWLSILLMTIGSISILVAVLMALVQKNYKRLLSYHAISQVGYMILGIGTALPIGIIGGLFHMINHALYKSCLFLTGGSVEKQAGTAELEKLGGLGFKMPITFICFIVAAASISGVPPFNGFFSKELIYDAALERNIWFYLAAILGSFLTAASFLKLGHAAFMGKLNDDNRNVKEAPWSMLIPMITIALVCIGFGVFNSFPLNHFIKPFLAGRVLEGNPFVSFVPNITLILITLLVFVLAILNHWFGVKKGGSGLKASDHIHYAPGFNYAYDLAEKKMLDPYEIGLKIVNVISVAAFAIDRAIDWIYETFIVSVTFLFTNTIRRMHSGNYATYIIWIIIGAAFVIMFGLR